MNRLARSAMLLMSGAMLLQIGGCMPTVFDIIQTILLGVTAAGSIAVIRNI